MHHAHGRIRAQAAGGDVGGAARALPHHLLHSWRGGEAVVDAVLGPLVYRVRGRRGGGVPGEGEEGRVCMWEAGRRGRRLGTSGWAREGRRGGNGGVGQAGRGGKG